MKLTPKYHDVTEYNNGEEFIPKQGLPASTLNKIVESSAYASQKVKEFEETEPLAKGTVVFENGKAQVNWDADKKLSVIKSLSEIGLTAPTTTVDILNKIFEKNINDTIVLFSNDNFNNITDTPTGYGTLVIHIAGNRLRPSIEFTSEVGVPATSKKYFGETTRTGNTFTGIEWSEVASMSEVPNPNLLINPDFKINQRGEQSYALNSTKYTVDRWVGTNGIIVTPNADGSIKVKNNLEVNYAFFSQYVEDIEKETGTTFTLSFCYKITMGDAFQVRLIGGGQPSKDFTSTTKTIDSYTVKMHNTSKTGFGFNIPKQTEIIIYWAKLERNDIPTKFEEPNPITELIKCQRYFQKARITAPFYASTANIAYPAVQLTTSLYRKPTTIERQKPSIRGNGSILGEGNIVQANANADNEVILEVTPPAGKTFTIGKVYMAVNGLISFDAEL